MINTEDGSVTIEKTKCVIKPSYTKEEFVSSELYNQVINKDSHTLRDIFTIKPQRISGLDFTLILYFDKSAKITRFELYYYDGQERTWKKWSKEKELRIKQIQDEWLISTIGNPPYLFSWGGIYSIYDEKAGMSKIIVRYKL